MVWRLPVIGRVVVAVACLGAGERGRAAVIFGVTGEGRLISFDSASPQTLTRNIPITGLLGTDSIREIDFRPATGQLYGLSQDNLASVGRLYTIDTQTGIATPGPVVTPLPGPGAAIDFNPVADRLRVVDSTGINWRVNPDTGAVIQDTPLNYAPGDPLFGKDPAVVSIAYTNNRPGATGTSLYGFDFYNYSYVLQDPPNAGLLTTLEFAGSFTDMSSVGFDILTMADGTNVGFVLGTTIFERHMFFTGDPTTAFAEVGPVGIGPNEYLFDIAAELPGGPANVPLPPAVVLGAGSAGMILGRGRSVRR